MTTRMEQVAQDVSLAGVRKAGFAAGAAVGQQAFKAAFQAGWPPSDSARPMNGAISTAAQAASKCAGQDAGALESAIGQAWQSAVAEAISEYFKTARRNFQAGESRQGADSPRRPDATGDAVSKRQTQGALVGETPVRAYNH